MNSIKFSLPLRLVSEANAREHPHQRAKRAKQERCIARLRTWAALGGKRIQPSQIIMMRIAPRLFDDDNAVTACKHIRDGIADAIRIDDRSPSIQWIVRQKKQPKTHALEVEIFYNGCM